jgi:LuxR family transcriptional regulator, maltose regulon positive regulatory protein
VDYESHAAALDRNELGALLVAAGLGPPCEHALISLLALNGLRVSEATGADIEHLGLERGHRTLTITRKGGKVVTIPLAPRTARAIDLAVGERTEGPVFLAADGRRLDRHGAGRIVRRIARRTGIGKSVTPHTLRNAFITAALDAGVPLRDVQEAASHADPRTTMRYVGPAAAWTGTPPTSSPLTSRALRGNKRAGREMLRLAASRQTELAAAASNHPRGDAPRPQREREPPFCAAWGSRSSGQVPVQMGVFCARGQVARRRCRRSARGGPGRSWCMAAVSMPASGNWATSAGRGAMMGTMGSAVGSGAVVGGVAGPGAGGIVSRPRLLGRLAAPARVIVVSAPAGSGKTVLLRSWIGQSGLAGRAAWVPAGRGERDPQQFWLAVLTALRQTGPGSSLVRPLTAAPDLDGGATAERLLTDLARLADRVWLVVDDVHELGPEVLRQLELLVMRAPPGLRFVLAARHDVRLGLHRLRLEGDLAEIREPDLRFTTAEAGQLFDAAGVDLPEVALLVQRTEGWAAGLRLAALSLAGHPDPGRRAAEFSGTERTVAEYLLAEVLDRQSQEVRRLLLRTSVLERVNGELAGLLTGDSGGERVLQDLEAANAFVVALDPGRSWFRYHRLFADLLQLQLRRSEPDQVAGLHRAAASWFAGHGYPVEAVRHAQAGQDWPLAARLLADRWPGLYLDGQAATVHELLAGFPAGQLVADAELAAVAGGDELARGSLEAAERYLGLAERASVPDGRAGLAQLLLGMARLLLARQRGDLLAVAEQARRLQAAAEAPQAAQPGLGDELRALALISLGSTEFWATRFEEAGRHLEQGVALGRRIGRPYLEFTGLAYQAQIEFFRSFALAMEHCRQAAELAERHGWADEPAAGLASLNVARVLTWQGRLEEAEPWMQGAERTLRAEADPAVGLVIRVARGVLELARGRDADALAAFQAADRLAGRLAEPNLVVHGNRSFLVHALVRLGETERAEQVLAGLGDQDRDLEQVRIGLAMLRLAQDDPHEALAALAPVLDGSVPVPGPVWLVQPFLLEAIARDALGDPDAAGRALERALDLAEPDGVLVWFVLHPVPGLLQRQARQRTAHAALIAEILGLLAGNRSAPPSAGAPLEPLSDSELRVLRYLPTNLSGPEIAAELYVSLNTVRTHLRHLYAKLGTHRRAEAVARARALGLLAPSPHRGPAARAG